MAEVINLNKARKAKAKEAGKTAAVENRVRFGRTKADRSLEQARAKKADRDLDQARRDKDD
ncbi:DUF4169 family protein [Caulobacter sp. NIBR2454]|uniref:DUF4169 family protein n=1 Tax=Caulobacter sp. NIBR2454 TaxID=3015996 RepID=UPI0022B60CAC|nr:DUF4169 family protein [Caulobacter sp. NIBR2454]